MQQMGSERECHRFKTKNKKRKKKWYGYKIDFLLSFKDLFLFAYLKKFLFSFPAPLTDKPPKILFPTENKISNMELQLGKIISGFPPAAFSCIPVVGNSNKSDRKWMTLQILPSTPPGTEFRSMTALSFAGETHRKKHSCKSGFHKCKL